MKKILKLGVIFCVLMFLFLGFNVNAVVQNRLNDWLFDFETYGDTRTNAIVHQQVVDQMVPLNSDFVLHVGDLVASGASIDDWNTFLSITSGYRDKTIRNGLTKNFYPSIGNHDYPLDNYRALFGFDDYYSFDYKGFHFIALNTSESYVSGSDQYNWLVNDLVANEDNEIIVFFHYPAYSSGPHGGTEEIVTYLSPLFESAQVKLVLTGHSHIYERTYPIYQNAVNYSNGVTYIITGGGGAPLGTFTFGNWWTAVGESTYEFVYLQVTSSKIYANVVDENGAEVDSFEIANTKNQKYLMTSLEDDGRKNIKQFSTSGNLLDNGFKPNSKYALNDGVRIASGDFNLDGKDELVVGSGFGSRSWVRVFDIYGNLLSKFYPFKKNYLGGVDVAAGDINGDNIDEIAVSKFTGERAKVKVFNYLDKSVYFDRIVYPNFETGVAVTMGDIDNDFQDELITGTGEGVRSKIKFFNVLSGNRLATELKPFKADIRQGIDVACGDIDNDGDLDIGASKLGDKGKIKVFDYATSALLAEIKIFRKDHKSGANLEMFDVNSDGLSEIIASQRFDFDSWPRVYIFNNEGIKIDSFFGYKKNVKGGVVVAGVNE